MAQKHIKQCPVSTSSVYVLCYLVVQQICSQKGYLCEGCHKDEIIFSFDRSTYQVFMRMGNAVRLKSYLPYSGRKFSRIREIEHVANNIFANQRYCSIFVNKNKTFADNILANSL